MKAFPLFALVTACSAYNPDLGGAPYKCGDSDPQCPDGYVCDASDPDPARHVCVLPGGSPDGGNNLQCRDDSPFGSNDTFQNAFVTPVAGMPMFTGRAAVCPENDKDHYQFNITTANTNIEVTTTWETAGAALNTSILNSAGTTIGNAGPMGANSVRVCIPNMNIGMFYVVVFAPPTIKNNYDFTIKVVPNC